jgi:hypothetical protein
MVAPRPDGPLLQGVTMFHAYARRTLAALSLVMLFVPAAHADDVTFAIKNSHPNAMRVELYSQDRDYVWPGEDKDYYLDDGETKQLPISCNAGESICYGAWVDGDEGTYWGVGPGNKEKCEDCCYTCSGGETEEINLIP